MGRRRTLWARLVAVIVLFVIVLTYLIFNDCVMRFISRLMFGWSASIPLDKFHGVCLVMNKLPIQISMDKYVLIKIMYWHICPYKPYFFLRTLI